MLDEISYTLLSDGSSDKALMPIIEWTIYQLRPALLVQRNWADFTRLRNPPKDMPNRITKALELYPCDVLFVHRDCEGEHYTNRSAEIREAATIVEKKYSGFSTVGIIPVRMMEAWLLINEQAIKTAAGNPNGYYTVHLPKIKDLEGLPDPKAILQDHLRQASGLKRRQLDKFNVGRAIHLVAENIEDFSRLNALPAYQLFKEQLAATLNTLESRIP